MRATQERENVQATCPDCGVLTSFESNYQGKRWGFLFIPPVMRSHVPEKVGRLFQLLRCASCGRAGLAEFVAFVEEPSLSHAKLVQFWPVTYSSVWLPEALPEEIRKEFREGERCYGISANRAAAALLRSALEKTLEHSGYTEAAVGRGLANRINAAAKDGVITDSRRARAHDEVRDLGNDVLHQEWRDVPDKEIDTCRQVAAAIIDDLYGDRPRVIKALKKAERTPADG